MENQPAGSQPSADAGVFKDLGENPSAPIRVMKWMYHYCCDNFDEMTDINKVLRGKLKEVAEIRAPKWLKNSVHLTAPLNGRSPLAISALKRCISRKTTVPRSASLRRWGVRWSVNSVPPPSRAFNRNLRVSEIIGGVACGENCRRSKVTGQRPITNVVMMGMGEPLLNLNNVVPAMEIMLDDFGFGLSNVASRFPLPVWFRRWINSAI